MNYTVPNNTLFVTSKKISTSRKESPAAKAIQEFCKNASVKIYVGPKDKVPYAEVRKGWTLIHI